MKRRVLVTGAAGFIGSHVAARLVERGDAVVGLDNFNDYYDPSRKRANASGLERLGGDFELIEGDLRDRALVERIFQSTSFDAVVHLAAMAGVRASVDDPWLYYDVNLTGTLTLLEATRRFGKPNFVFASTSSAYGRTKESPFLETAKADRPLAPYPASKRSAELLGHSYHHLHGVDFTALRFFTVYGPAGRPDMLAYLALDAIRTQKTLTLYEGGALLRDWTYVSDIASGVVAAVDRRLGYEIINLGRGQPVNVREFVDLLSEYAGRAPCIEEQPMPAADVDFTLASIDKARALLGYEPRVSVREGTRHFYDWFVEHVGPIG